MAQFYVSGKRICELSQRGTNRSGGAPPFSIRRRQAARSRRRQTVVLEYLPEPGL